MAKILRKFSFVGLSSISTLLTLSDHHLVLISLLSFVPLPKSQKPERVRSNIDVFNFEISREDIERLDELNRGKEGAVTWNPVDVD
jgi:diketogulonate reductase-like aldo/keto reductase